MLHRKSNSSSTRNANTEKSIKKIAGKIVGEAIEKPIIGSEDFQPTVDLLHKIEIKILVQMGATLIKGVVNTSVEGKIGAATLGGAATIAAIADGKVNSLEAAGVVGMAFLGMLIGEAFTPAEDFYQKGVELYQKAKSSQSVEDYLQAVEHLNKAINKNKSYTDAYLLRGIVHYSLGEFEKALESFSQTILLDSRCIEVYRRRAAVYYLLGDYEGYILDSLVFLPQYPHDAESYFKQGMAYIKLNQVGNAMESLSQAIKSNGNHGLAYLTRGLLYLERLSDPLRAVENFNRALCISPKLDEAYLARAKAYLELEKIDSAIQDYSQAINSSDRDVKCDAYSARCIIYLNLARDESRKGNYRNSISYYKKSSFDYHQGNAKSDEIRKIIIEGKCFSNLKLGKKWQARYDAFWAGLSIEELRLNQIERIAVFAPFLVIPTILLGNPIYNFAIKNISHSPRLSSNFKQESQPLTSKQDQETRQLELKSPAVYQTISFDGGSYKGYTVDGKANGEGLWTHPNGSRLEGKFKDNQLIDGTGVTIGTDYRFEGNIRNRVRSGKGFVTFTNGQRYEGHFENNNPNGQGITKFPDGTTYEGEHKNGNFDGYGKLSTSDGIRWIGKFKDGKQDGKLIVTVSNGKSASVTCVRGSCQVDKTSIKTGKSKQ